MSKVEFKIRVDIPRNIITNALIKNNQLQFDLGKYHYSVLYIDMEEDIKNYLNNNGIRVRCENESIHRVDIESPEIIEKAYGNLRLSLDLDSFGVFHYDTVRSMFVRSNLQLGEYLDLLYVEVDDHRIASYIKMML